MNQHQNESWYPYPVKELKSNKMRKKGHFIKQLMNKMKQGKRTEKKTNQEIRKGSSKLLNTLIIKFSLVTDSICGPGNCPLIKIPWKKKNRKQKQNQHFFSHKSLNYQIKKWVLHNIDAKTKSNTCCLTPRGQMSP